MISQSLTIDTALKHRRVRVLIFYFIAEVPALLVIGLWAVTQLANGVGSLGIRTE